MNEYLINKQYLLKELEDLLSQKSNKCCVTAQDDMIMYCQYMRDFYLSCSTNN